MKFYFGERRQGEYAERRRRAWSAAPPASDAPDSFTYDPMNPVPSYGGNVCCTGNAVQGGAFDQTQDGRARRHSGLHLRAA